MLGPAGALASTANDLARFAIWQLKAGRSETDVVRTGTLAETQRPQVMAPDWSVGVGLAWHSGNVPNLGFVLSHNGGIASYFSHISLAPDRRVGVVILTNSGHDANEIGIWTLRQAIERFSSAPQRESETHAESQP